MNATEPSARKLGARRHAFAGIVRKAASFNSTPQPGFIGTSTYPCFTINGSSMMFLYGATSGA